MDNPRADKVAVVDEVRSRLEASDGAVLTEYRGLTVAESPSCAASWRPPAATTRSTRTPWCAWPWPAGPRRPSSDLLTGPTAIAFVHGDVSAVAKALRDFARNNPSLVVKGGVVGTGLLSAADICSCWPISRPGTPCWPRSPGPFRRRSRQLAGLIEALPRQPRLRALGADRKAGSGRRGLGGPG